MRKKRALKKLKELSDFEFLEMRELTLEERNELFTRAIHEMVGKGLITPDEAKDYLKNINKWLMELLEG